jgi:Flp pilus assembly secretin CpaC
VSSPFLRLATTAATACVVASVATMPSASSESVAVFSIQTGRSIVLQTPNLERVAVGDSKIAGIVPLGTSEVVVNGKSPGHTTIFIWTNGARKTYEFTVTDQNLDAIAGILRGAIDQPNVEIVTFGQNIILRGSVPDAAAMAKVTDVLQRFNGVSFSAANAGQGKIVNALVVKQPLGNIAEQITQNVPDATNIRIDSDPDGDVIVSGDVKSRVEAENVLQRARGLAGPFLAASGKVIDRLEVGTTSQIDVKVYVLEIDKTGQSQLGLRLQTATETQIGQPQFTISGQPSLVSVEFPAARSPFSLGAFQRVSLLAPTLDLLLTQGHARILSSPDLVAMPGKEATFLVGGQIPIPVSNGLGTVSIIYKDYGVNLDVTPSLLGDGSVETKINPEISDLDFGNGIQLNGYVVPALKTSRITTDVITKDGESIVMGGLLRRVESKNLTKIPLLSDIPILGKLFTSTAYQSTNTDVVFVMTPTVVTK